VCEALLLPLKSQAARERWAPEKGLKDRIDVLSLLLYSVCCQADGIRRGDEVRLKIV
jgi:hypothetical protein